MTYLGKRKFHFILHGHQHVPYCWKSHPELGAHISPRSEVAVEQIPDVYLDNEVETGAIGQSLDKKRFHPALTSIVTAVHRGNDGAGVTLEQATLSLRSLWCAMYSEGFGRSDEITAAEGRER